MIGVLIILALNFTISWHNATSVGRVWSESKAVGGSFRSYTVAGFVMAVCGFTMVYGVILVLAIPTVLPLFMRISPAALYDATALANDMLYVLIAAFIIPSGFAIWYRNVVSLWERRTLGEGLRLGWNTYAQVRNTISVARHAPSALSRIGKALLGGKKKGNAIVVIIAIMAVILAALGGYFTADAIVRRTDAAYDAYGELEARAQRA